MSAKSTAALSSTLALCLACFSAVGAPPSIVVDPPSVWLALEPLMFPALLAGVLFSLLGILASPFHARVAASASMGGALSSMIGVVVAGLIDAERGVGSALIPVALLAMPLLLAAQAWRQARTEQQTD